MDKPLLLTTIKFIDEYCASYKNLFPEGASFRHLSICMSNDFPIKQDSPEIAKVTGRK